MAECVELEQADGNALGDCIKSEDLAKFSRLWRGWMSFCLTYDVLYIV